MVIHATSVGLAAALWIAAPAEPPAANGEPAPAPAASADNEGGPASWAPIAVSVLGVAVGALLARKRIQSWR